MKTITKETIPLKNDLEIPGLIIRNYQGETDYPKMLEIINASKKVDKINRTDTLEDIIANYSKLSRCTPETDIFFAEVNGEPLSYGRCWWGPEENNDHIYSFFVFIKPEWRDSGIGERLSQMLQDRAREISKDHPADAPKYLEVYASDTETWHQSLYAKDGFKAVRYDYAMQRDTNLEISDAPRPEGIEIRPYRPEDLHKIWLADNEAFRDHWGYIPPTEKDVDFGGWQEKRTFTPDLWKVAWKDGEVAGMVLNMLDEQENQEYNRKRGYTENISVRRPYRKQGLARYLLTESIKMFKEMGMEHTSLGVDTENPNGALKLYKNVGYQVEKQSAIYRKPLNN